MFRLRRLARWTGTLVVAVLLTIAAVAVVVETDWFKNWLRLRLVGGLASVLDGELRVGRLGGSLWTGVTLDEVEILNKDGQVVKADHIRVRYDPFTLARRRWIVDTVVVERASIQVVETADGWNVLHLLKPRPQSGNPPTVWIRKLELTDSTVTIDSRAEVPRTLTGVDLDSSLTVTRGVTSMTFDSLHAFDEVTGLTLHDLSGSASDNFRTFDVKFNADSAGMGIDGTAQGEMAGTTRTLSAVIDTRHVDLARLLGRPRLASDISGRANVQATLPPAGGQSRVTFQFSGPGSRAFGYAAEHIEAKGEIAGGAVKFDSRVSGYGAHATVEGTWRWATNARAATFAGRGTFASVDVRRLPATLRLPLLESNLSGRYDTAVDGNGWRAHAVFSGGVVEGATIGEGTEGNIVSAGGVTLYGGVGAASHVNLQRFGRVVPVAAISTSRFDSDLSGDFFVAGQTSADAPHLLVGGAILGSSVISGTNVSRMNAVAYLSERRLVVSANGKFEGLNDTTLGVPSVSIAATGEANGWFAIADIDLPITEDNLEVDARVDLRPSTIRGVAVDSAAVDARLMDGVLTLNSVDIRNPDATVRASGALGLHEAVASEGIALIADINDRTFLERMLQRPLLAAGSIDAKITGTVASPSATGSLTLHQISYNETTTALTSTTRFTVDWPERDVERLAWKVNGEASFVTFGNTELQRLTATAVGGLREMAVDVTAEQRTRSIGIEGRLTLKPDAHELLLRRLALTTENIAWSLPAEQSAVIKYAGNHLDISDLTLVRGEQRIMVAGGFDLEGAPHPEGGRTSLDVKVQNVELADINHILLGTRQLTGRVNGAVTIGGSRQDPVVDGEITIRDGLVETVPYQAVQTRGKYAGGVATIDALLDQAPGASLHVTGTVPIAGKEAASKSMDLHVSGGPVNLGLVQAFTTEIDKVLGDVALDLHLTGSIGDPIVNGTATLANGAFDVKGTGVRYRSIEAALDFAASQMSIRHLQVADGTGDLLTASGGLDVHRGIAARALDIQVRAKSFSVLANRFGTAELNADIRVSGELAAPVVKGTATLEGGRLEVAEILERTTATPYSTTAQAEPGAEPATPTAALTPWDRADIALQVRLPDNLVLRGRNLRVSSGGFGVGDMNIVTGGTFDVTKRPSAPIDIRGTLEVVRGSYSFQGRRFDIQRGSDVRFRGGSITDPFLNVNATREVSGITAEVRLRGSARSPELTLTSRPALDESDILSLIVFNQPVSSLGSAQQANLGQRAAAMAAGAIASPLADSIGRALNLDLFEIQAPTSEDGAGSVLIGSQLGSRVLLGLRQQFGRTDTSLVTLEYRVSELLRFVTTIASGTLQAHATRRTDRGGVDLIFVIRY